MRRGTTPTNTFSVNLDLTGATVFVSYEQDRCVVLEKTGEDLEISADKVVLELSQEDTLAFRPGDVCIQIRAVMPDGTAVASNIIQTTFQRIIKDGVIEHV